MERIYSWLEVRSRNIAFPWLLCIGLVLLSWSFSPPCFDCFNATAEPWEVVTRKAADLTDPLTDIPPDSWLSKKVFRLTVPVLMKVFQLQPLHVIIIHFLLGYLTLVLSYLISRRITKDALTSIFFTIAITFIYFGRASFYDLWLLWFDGFAYFFLILALFLRHPAGIFLAATAAAWTDERGFIALGLVYFFHQLVDRSGRSSIDMIKPVSRGISVLAAMAVYLLMRWYMSNTYGMHTSSKGAELAFLQWTMRYLPIGAWTFFEGLWLIFFAAALQAIRSRQHFILLIITGSAVLAVAIPGCVSDITRSGSYFIPLIFIAIAFLATTVDREQLRRMMGYSAGISLLFPATFVCIDWGIEKWFQLPIYGEWGLQLLVVILNAMK